MVITRIAPSPTGFPHIGTIYQALFDFAYARKNNGSFILRIEDTDRARLVDGAEENIRGALDWFGLIPDESPWREGPHAPYRQSERLSFYHESVMQLIQNGYARFVYFPKSESGEKDHSSSQVSKTDFDAEGKKIPDSIEEMIAENDWIVRMIIPKDTVVTVKDEIRGDISFNSTEITEQVLLKSDGFPTYHLASVVDDHLMGVTHVIRGEEWLTSTPKHWLLYEYFGWEKPKFYHTPVLRNPDKSKLSKRHGHTNVSYYQELGFFPEAILNYLALLGWSHPEEKEIFSMQEFITLLNLEDIKPVAPIFDIRKLEWMNGEYMRSFENAVLEQKLYQFDSSLRDLDPQLLSKMIEPAKTRMKLLPEFRLLIEPFLGVSVVTPPNDIKNNLRLSLETLENWDRDEILNCIKEFLSIQGVKFPDIYEAIIGVRQGLPLPEVFEILGKEKVLALLR